MANPGYKIEALQQAIDATAAHGSKAAAARALGLNVNTFKARHLAAEEAGLTPQCQPLIAGERAAATEGMGLSKVTTQFNEAGTPTKQWVGNRTVSEKVRNTEDPPALLDGMMLKGVSTFYDGDGRKSAEWVLQRADAQRQADMQKAALEALCANIVPLAPIVGPLVADTDLLNLYTMTDCHVGMLAWKKETGEPWDLDIAEQCLTDIFFRMIDAAPDAAVGIVNQLGDFLHFDSLTPETPAHRHILDADSRYQKVVMVSVRILRRIIERALTKHETVQVYMHEGNHDPAGSVWLRVMFAQLYENNPRVRVEQSPNPYTAYEFGKTFLGFHHGHLLKPASMPLLFASLFAEMWGRTQYRYGHCGHRHHVEEKEHPGLKTIQHPTLSAPDAYAARGGWLSKRQATSMTYHKEHGEVARGIFIPTT